jgi:hypothetical protein
MSRVVKVNQGDYIVQTRSGGDIILDIGPTGYVTVTGNLKVIGASTQINTTNMTITDNIIVLNQNESGAGVTLGQSGIEVDRGSYAHAQIIWDESVSHYDPVLSSNVTGTFVAKLKAGNPTGLQVSTLVGGLSNLEFDMQSTNYVLSIANSTNYEQRVLNTNDIPNRKFVTDYVSASGGTANVSNIHFPLTGTSTSGWYASDYTLSAIVGGNTKTTITSAGVQINNILIANDSITDTSSGNLKLGGASNSIEVNGIINLDNIESLSGTYVTTAASGTNKIYSSVTLGPGKTGVYVSNTGNTDELMSRSRAVLLSILL